MKNFNGFYCDQEMSEDVYNWIKRLEWENNTMKEYLKKIQANLKEGYIVVDREAVGFNRLINECFNLVE